METNEHRFTLTQNEWMDVFNTVSDILFVLDDLGFVIHANDAALKVLKKELHEIYGQYFLDYYDCFGIPLKENFVLNAVKNRKLAEERCFCEETGKWFRCTVFPQRDGGATCVVRIMDVTDEKAMQERFTHMQKLSVLSSIVSGVAHEINNPLSIIMGFSELASMREDGDPHIKNDLMEVQSAANRVHKIVKGFLSFSRRQNIQKDMHNVNALIEEIGEVVKYDFKVNNMKLELQLEENLPPVLCDGHQLQQVFVNLITNAKHALEESEGEQLVCVETRRGEDGICVYVKDKGSGIPEHVRDKLFEPFFTTKKAGKGTGLGLSISREIVIQHGGDISLQEDEGWSTVFCVRLPADKKRTVEPQSELVEDVTDVFEKYKHLLYGKKILVIDDEEQIRTLLNNWLKACDVDVELAVDGKDALRKLSSGNYFDCVVCDMRMPDLTGEDVFLYVEVNRPQLCSRMLFATGDVVNDKTQAFFQGQNLPYVEKPFMFSDFMDKIVSVTSE